MNKKLIIISVAVGVIVLLLAMALFLFGLLNREPSAPATSIFGTDTPPPEVGRTDKQIPTTDGGSVSVPDFTKDREPVAGFEGSYYDLVYGSEPIFGNEEYSFEIQYDETRAEFLVVLTEEPLGESRREAEEFLKNKLSLTEEALCTLNVFVAVPLDVNELYSQYPNLGLSFCPSSVPLP